jgi:hypothetical protein
VIKWPECDAVHLPVYNAEVKTRETLPPQSMRLRNVAPAAEEPAEMVRPKRTLAVITLLAVSLNFISEDWSVEVTS